MLEKAAVYLLKTITEQCREISRIIFEVALKLFKALNICFLYFLLLRSRLYENIYLLMCLYYWNVLIGMLVISVSVDALYSLLYQFINSIILLSEHCKFRVFNVSNYKLTNWYTAGNYVSQRIFSSDRFNCHLYRPKYTIAV